MNKYLEKIAYMKDLYEDLGLQKEDIPEEFVAGTLAAGGGIAFHTVNKRSITPLLGQHIYLTLGILLVMLRGRPI